ncbi:MAG: ABC transporter permease, partial [Chthoniobacterales bacterium]
MVASIGNFTLSRVRGLGDYAIFLGLCAASVFSTRRLASRVARSIYEQGFRCLPVILIVGLFTGLVLGLQ